MRAANLALLATVALTAAKIAVSILTGSVGLLSEAIHSGLDLISSILTSIVVRASTRPPDWDHPFGHGKLESLSAMFEAVLLIIAAAFIGYEGVTALRGQEYHPQNLGWGIAVTAISVVVNLVVYVQNRDVGASAESIAIETNAYHFLTDVFTSLALLVGLLAMNIMHWTLVDPVLALLIGVYVFVIGLQQIRKCFKELSDSSLPEDEVQALRAILDGHQKEFLNYHELRTRKVGAVRHIELHLEMCSDCHVDQAHRLCDRIEDDINKRFSESYVNIHVEPCGNHGPGCVDTCRFNHTSRKGGAR